MIKHITSVTFILETLKGSDLNANTCFGLENTFTTLENTVDKQLFCTQQIVLRLSTTHEIKTLQPLFSNNDFQL